jgi:hypothetical protein
MLPMLSIQEASANITVEIHWVSQGGYFLSQGCQDYRSMDFLDSWRSDLSRLRHTKRNASFKSRSDLLYQSLWLFPNWADTREKDKSSESSEASKISKYIWRMLRCYRYLSMLSSHHEGWGLLFTYLWHYYYLWHGNAWQVEILTWFFLWHFCHDQSTMISPSSITYANQDSS